MRDNLSKSVDLIRLLFSHLAMCVDHPLRIECCFSWVFGSIFQCELEFLELLFRAYTVWLNVKIHDQIMFDPSQLNLGTCNFIGEVSVLLLLAINFINHFKYMTLEKILKTAIIGTLVSGSSLLLNARIGENPQDIQPLFEGSSVPNAHAYEVSGEQVEFPAYLGEGRSVLIFYRGGWCPYCNTHLQELVEIEDDLLKLGFKIIAISPDQPSVIQTYLDGNPLKYTLLSDSEHSIGEAFGVTYRVSEKTNQMLKGYNIDLDKASGNSLKQLPVPSVFIIDEGTIEFSYVNPDYKTRLSADVVLAAAKFSQGN